METKSILKLLFVIIVVASVVGLAYLGNDTKEAFGMLPSFQAKVWMETEGTGKNKGDFFSVPGQYQAMLSPRMSNVDYGANIRYNMPSVSNQAVPTNPLSMSKLVSKEKYDPPSDCGCAGNGCGAITCGKGGCSNASRSNKYSLPAGYTAGDFKTTLGGPDPDNKEKFSVQSSLPVGTMNSINALGDIEQPIIYDRYVYANRNSSLRSQGDPIRGDLPIVPCAAEWFRPSVQPHIDLQQGALTLWEVMMLLNNNNYPD